MTSGARALAIGTDVAQWPELRQAGRAVEEHLGAGRRGTAGPRSGGVRPAPCTRARVHGLRWT
jgi:hypothetical protein